MSASAHAVAPPVHAVAPPVQRKAEPMAEAREAPLRLLASLSSVPAVQRRCAGCAGEGNEDRMPVQPRLKVGPVDDPYEREADNIANQVLAMRNPHPVTMAPASIQRVADGMPELIEDDAEIPRKRAETGGAAGGVVQRVCAACGGQFERVRRAPVVFSELAKDDEGPPRMPAAVDNGDEHIAASSTQLTSGGSSLAGPTRDFFESRMGRDLSDVRVHHDGDSDALNQSISARAFTFQNHIWLSQSESEGPGFTMAHELAHVVQQTRPGAVRTRKRGSTAPVGIVRRAPALKFAGNPYWTSEPLEKAKKNSGSQIHEDLLEQFQKTHTKLLIEAPIPKARASKAGRSRSGEADLYIGTDAKGNERTIGINFRRKGDPARMRSSTTQPHHAPPYSHKTSARPQLKGSKIIGAEEAPKDIALGELKPDKVKKGSTQLDTYENSIKRTQSHTNAYLKTQHAGAGATPPEWPEPSFTRIGLSPPSLAGAKGTSFGRHKLVVYQFAGFKDDDNFAIGNLVHEPPNDVFGELKVKKHTNGIYYYWWEPDVDPKATSLPPDLARQSKLSDDLFLALKTNRKVVLPLRRKSPQRRSAAATPAAQTRSDLSRLPAVARAGQGVRMRPAVMRRKSGNVKKFGNNFDATFETTKWLPNRKKVADAYAKVAKTYKGAKGPASLTDWYLMEIDKDLESGDRQNIEAKFKAKGKPAERAKQLRQMHILSQPFAPTMAKLRRLFGGVFAKGSELYEKIKAKFERRSKPSKSVSGGGILGALIRVSFKVLLLIGRRIVASTMIQLTEQLKTCMSNMFKSYFSIDEQVEAIQARIDGVKGDLEQTVNNFVGGDPEQMAETLFGPYGQHVDTVRTAIEGFTEKAGPIMTAYRVVKWGIQALACASPPLLGCLWGLARSAIEWAAGKVIETCWFMKKVTPKILKIEAIRDFMSDSSVKLSNGIIEAGSKLFPDPVGSFLRDSCKTETPKVGVPKSSSICEEGGGSGGMGNDPKPSQEALDFWARWEKLPFKKQMALKKMLGVENAKGGATVDWDKMNKMLDWAEAHDVAEMQRLASEAAKGDSSAIPGAVAKVKQAAEAVKSKSKSKDGSGTTEPKSSDSSADSGDGNERDETEFAKRAGKISGKGGGPAADLTPRGIVTVYKGTPSRVGEAVSGTVVIAWRKPSGETVARFVENVTLAFQRVGPDKVEIEGKKHDVWVFHSTSNDTYAIEGRENDFYFPLKQDIPLIVIKAGESKP